MWQPNYIPLADSLPLSALVAALPIVALLLLLGVMRKPAWMASLIGLGTAILVAAVAYGMPAGRLLGAATNGAAFGLFPIGWVVFSAILLYRVTVESGRFEILKDSVGGLTSDPRLQALLIAFAFGAFVEGAAGFGTPVAVAGAMLAGLGVSPFRAAAICLLANTAPVAFGSIAVPITTLANTTNLPFDRLSAGIGRICAPVSLIVPAYLIVVMFGWKGLRSVFPAVALCGVVFAGTQFTVSNFLNAQLTDILSSMAAMAALVALIKIRGSAAPTNAPKHEGVFTAWAPYLLLVVFVLAWGYAPIQKWLDHFTVLIHWPGLPAKAAPFKLSWASASGTACLLAALFGAAVVGLSPARFLRVVGQTVRQLALAEMTLAVVLGLAYVMNHSGATTTLGLAFAATGAAFPFASAMLGWLGVFLTGSDTSANALFGNLQVVTAHKLGMNPILMAASNSSGGVMGKMISLTSIAVAACATNMKREDESLLFRFTLKHSLLLASVIGLIVTFYAYVMPSWAP
ncbi:MAG: L-lactate permease [Ignavibacteriota bacterium]